jgi:hypothetical protein
VKWKIIAMDNSAVAIRLGVTFGIETARKVEGKFDGLIFFNVGPNHLSHIVKFYNVPKILYWTGTDVKMFLEDKKSKPDFSKSIHVTDSPNLISKLGEKISTVYFLPIPLYLPVPKIELEEPYGVLVYINRHIARDIRRTKAVMEELPNIPFFVLSGQGTKVPKEEFPSNVTTFEWISEERKRDLFKKVSVYLRLMNFDGLSNFVIEMKALGRHVVYTNPAPFCDFVTLEESPKTIANRVERKMKMPLDTEGAEWYKTVFSKENFSRTAKELCAKKGWDFPYA